MPHRRTPKRRHDIDQPRGECVYLVDASNAVKIGFSTNVAARVDALQTGCADKLRLVGVWYDGRAKQIERLTHQFLKPYRTEGKGEWFCIEPDLAAKVIDEMFAQFPRNSVNKPQPKMLLVCKECGHSGIVPYATVGRFSCSNCKERHAIRFHAFPCQEANAEQCVA